MRSWRSLCLVIPLLQGPGGFLWYEDPLLKPEAKQEPAPVSPSVARERNQALKQELEDAIQVVLDKPTVDNAVTAQRLQKKVMDRSEAVSRAWVLAALLDAGLVTPDMNPHGVHREVAANQKQQQDLAQLKRLSQEWGLFFAVKPTCPYCQKFIPILKSFVQETGFQVLAVSPKAERRSDTYGPFPWKADEGLMAQMNPQGDTPALFLIHRDGKRLYPVARGLTHQDALQRNILAMVRLDDQRRKQAP